MADTFGKMVVEMKKVIPTKDEALADLTPTEARTASKVKGEIIAIIKNGYSGDPFQVPLKSRLMTKVEIKLQKEFALRGWTLFFKDKWVQHEDNCKTGTNYWIEVS